MGMKDIDKLEQLDTLLDAIEPLIKAHGLTPILHALTVICEEESHQTDRPYDPQDRAWHFAGTKLEEVYEFTEMFQL